MTITTSGCAGDAMVGIDVDDVAELGHICAYLVAWLTCCPDAADSLAGFTADPKAAAVLINALSYFEVLLGRHLSSPSPDHLEVPGPLGPGEAQGLAGLLESLATDGWPTGAGHADALRSDCRRWAARLTTSSGWPSDSEL